MQELLSTVVFFQHIRLKKIKRSKKKDGTKKEQFERRVQEIKYKANRINSKLK